MKFKDDLKNEFSGYNGGKLLKDFMAGITVSAVALPLALAFGVSSGADAAAGLITAILAGIIIGLLSGASYQISGPTGAMSAILIGVISVNGLDGMFIATFMSGIILVLAGLFKLGRVVSVIPMPVITGFTSGIAIIIALGQVDNFFGTHSVGNSVIEKMLSYRDLGFNIDVRSLIIGITVIAIMVFWPKKFAKFLPSSLGAIIIVLILNTFLKWDIATVGVIPKTLFSKSRLNMGHMNLTSIKALMPPALSIAALGMIESLLCGASAGRAKNEPLNADRELLAQGIGNIIIPFFGGVPATAAIARTSVAIKAGQQTRLTSVIHSLGLLASMFLLSSVMGKIPLSALAGVLIMTAFRMNEWSVIKYLFKHKMNTAIAAFVVTMAATVVFDLSIAIISGLAFSCILFVAQSSNSLSISVVDVDNARLSGNEGIKDGDYSNVKVAYISGSLFFGNVQKLTKALGEIDENCKSLIISARGLSNADSSAIQAIREFGKMSKEKGVTVYLVGLQENVMQSLEKGGFEDFYDRELMLWSTQNALEHLNSK